MFSDQDIEQINSHGLTIKNVSQQLNDFKKGFPFINIIRPALIDDGIFQCDDESDKYIKIYDEYSKNHKIVKFVPASGAATRMFKDLFDFITTGTKNKTSVTTIANIQKFAFWDELKSYLPENASDKEIIQCILTQPGLDYGEKPKALILFHNYENGAKTALEEHLTEGAEYAKSGDCVNIHFTISPEHRDGFENLLNRVITQYENEYGVKYNVTMSEQKKSTDTIAVNMDNTPFRNPDRTLLFRPAGHGALIENLGDLDADLIFIKNIDNITTQNLRGDTIKYKKMLAGILVNTQKQIFEYIKELDSNTADLDKIHTFILDKLNVKLDKKLSADEYKHLLNRPLRVCGIVKNTGEPGGGPFWVADENGYERLQIAEPGQIAPESKHLLLQGEFFNPTDLVCATKDYTGKKFDLKKYIDNSTGFISEKSKNGIPLRAMERPGLWNGSMAKWNTILVAVPGTTFTPVKVVTDLLSAPHQTKIS